MPARFRFRKLYADLAAPDGSVCIAYVARLQVLGFDRTLAAVELYAPDGSREVLRARAAPLAAPKDADAPPRIRLELGRGCGVFELACADPLPPWSPPGDAPAPGLRWSVVTPRATMRVRWTGAPAGRDLFGTGYMDWVELQRPTRWTGIQALQWGRLHPVEGAVVFTGVRDRSGRWWRRLAHWSPAGSRPDIVDDFRLDRTQREVRLSWKPAAGSIRSAVLLPRRALHEGAALDAPRSPGLVERAVLRLITGRSAETRWLSRLESSRPGCDTGSALHEEVRFGR